MSNLLQRTILSAVLLCMGLPSFAQNLVPNPSFETLTQCPTGFQGICQGWAVSWTCPTLGTSDLYNVCSDPLTAVSVPRNSFGYQNARTGDGYAGILCKWPTPIREYLKVDLGAPLDAGQWYQVSFYVSLANFTCGVEHIGAFFTSTDVYQSTFGVLNFQPQVEASQGFLNDTTGWELITGCFQAVGGEQYMIIGNFRNDADTPIDADCDGVASYYYVEDISVEIAAPPEDIGFDLGGPEFSCTSFEIDPQQPGPIFHWSDGSDGPTLVVLATGTYVLTISDGCSSSIDSVLVTIGGNNPPVDLGPDELTICAGESYTISLDPLLSTYEWNNGSNDPVMTVTSPALYSVTLDDGCTSSTDQINIHVMEPPIPILLGEDMVLCDGDALSWAFDPLQGQYIWQDGSTGSSYTVQTPGIYSVTCTNMCGNSTDEITVTSMQPPVIDLGEDMQMLCNGQSLVIEIDPSQGQIQWQDGSTDSTYSITDAGNYAVTVTNVCGSAADQIQINTMQSPEVDLGPDLDLCQGEAITLSGGSFEGSYEWQDHSTESDLTVYTGGTYSLTVTNACGTDADDIYLTFEPVVTPPDLGPDIVLCPGASVSLHAHSDGANYLWQDMSTADSLIVTNAGTYIVKVFNSCSTFSDTVVVSLNDSPPVVNLPAQQSLCQGQAIALDAGVQGVLYTWNDNSHDQQLIIHQPGTYSVTVSNACGTDRDTVIITDGGQAPEVALGTDISICPGETFTIHPTFSQVDAWHWQDGSNQPSYTVTTGGLITVEVSNTCSSAFDTLNVILLPILPPLDLGADTSLCPGQSMTFSINIQGASILWPDGSTDQHFTISGPAQVYAMISNSCGTSTDTIAVHALPDIPDLNLGTDQLLCPGELITLMPGIADVQYHWSDGSNSPTYQTNQQETISLTISNACGTSSDTLEIIASTLGPQVNLGPDLLLCEGEIATISSGISGVDYLWQDGSSMPTYTSSQSGMIILQVSNNCGTDTDTISVEFTGSSPSVDLGSDTSLCIGNTMQLIYYADAITTSLWQDGSTQPTFMVSTPGIYTLTASNRCGSDQDSIIVSYLAAPAPFSLGADTTLCPGEKLVLSTPSTAYDILWQDGSHEPSYVADQTATYSLQLSNACGMTSDALEVNYDNRIPSLPPDKYITWCEGEIITLDVTQPFDAGYTWNDGSISPVLQVETPGLYHVEVTTPCQSASQKFDIVPDNDCDADEVHRSTYIPNVFSPNGDGINDGFLVSFNPDFKVIAIEGSIFDRYGNQVFHSATMPFIWNGQFALNTVLPGAYAYLIRISYLLDGEEHSELFKGDVTVLR